MGTLNEFTVAFDEGKVIGVIQGIDGIADHIQESLMSARGRPPGMVVCDSDP